MTAAGNEPVEVRRSRRRTRTVSAYRKDGKVIVLIPARFSRAQEDEWVAKMLVKLDKPTRRRPSDAALMQRARRLSADFLDGRAQPTSVRWVTNQNARWASCSPTTGEIRMSHRLQPFPSYVVDAVLMHELAHLLVPGHGPDFWALADRYPLAEKAKGFLDGVSHGAGIDLSEIDVAEPE